MACVRPASEGTNIQSLRNVITVRKTERFVLGTRLVRGRWEQCVGEEGRGGGLAAHLYFQIAHLEGFALFLLRANENILHSGHSEQASPLSNRLPPPDNTLHTWPHDNPTTIILAELGVGANSLPLSLSKSVHVNPYTPTPVWLSTPGRPRFSRSGCTVVPCHRHVG